jgi:hypothetical protein
LGWTAKGSVREEVRSGESREAFAFSIALVNLFWAWLALHRHAQRQVSARWVLLGVVGRAAPPEKQALAISLTSMGSAIGQFVALPYTHMC